MRWSLNIGKIFGIPVRLHVTFLAFVAWIAVGQGVATGDPSQALSALLLLFLVFLCVVLHELGHALVARRYGIRTQDIVLLPIGGVARLERMPEKPSQELAVALAGPAVNVAILALLSVLLSRSDAPLPDWGLEGGLLPALWVVNKAMVVFNLIPAFPMDGGRVLRSLLAMAMPYARATRVASITGQALALGFGLVGLFANHAMLIFIALFVFLAAGEERAIVETRTSLSGVPVRDAMLSDFVTLEVGDPLQRAVDHLIAGSQQDFPVLEGEVPIGTLGRAELIIALQKEGADTPVGKVVRRDPAAAAPGEPLEGVLQRMRARGRTALPVLEGGRVVGLVTIENISDLLLVSAALKKHDAAAAAS
ncbi:MAG TPA: site-2 protease family protein [Candidatus Eisenbacteria bacterium]|jgi:Zn-dependent protease